MAVKKKTGKVSTAKKVAKKTTKKKATKKKVAKKTTSKKATRKKVVSKKTPIRKIVSKSSKLEIKKIQEEAIEDFHLTAAQLAIHSKRVYNNKAKRKIALDMLERYTGHRIVDFQQQIILTNFHYYIERFNTLLPDAIYTSGSAFKASSSRKAQVTIIEFGIGSAMAALIAELLGAIEPTAVLFLGMCGGTHSSLKVGDFILPIGAIRSESVSQHFMPMQVPALPTFKIQKFASQIMVEHGYDYRTGTVHSTDLRFWEFDKEFKLNLYQERVIAVEMECAALFIACFASKVPIGAMLLVSDTPLKKGGIKTKKSAKKVFKKYTDIHIDLGIEIMADIAQRGDKIRHYKW
jgi:AMP nucleosidase